MEEEEDAWERAAAWTEKELCTVRHAGTSELTILEAASKRQLCVWASCTEVVGELHAEHVPNVPTSLLQPASSPSLCNVDKVGWHFRFRNFQTSDALSSSLFFFLNI